MIQIAELELTARIGVPDEERERPQRLTISMTLWPRGNFEQLDDQLDRTVDYAAVCREVKEFVSGRTDKLIETLADAVAHRLLSVFELLRVRVEVRKFVLPNVKHVAVIVERERASR